MNMQVRDRGRRRLQGKSTGHRKNPLFKRKRPSISIQLPEGLKQWLKKDGWAIIGIVFFVVLGAWYFGFKTGKFLITDIQVQQTEFTDYAEVQQAVSESIQKPIAFVVPRNYYWTLRSSRLREILLDHFNESYAIEEIRVTKEWPNKVSIEVDERVPAVTWITLNHSTKDERIYTVDRSGYVAQSLGSVEDTHQGFPRVYDGNRPELANGDHVASEQFMSFLLDLNEAFPEQTDYEIEKFHFPVVDCKERQYVAEEIFEQEILESSSEEFKERKREIQQQFLDGLLTIDQSLEELERLKTEELTKLGELDADGFKKTEWQTVYVETPCDFPKVATDLHLEVADENGGFIVYFDTGKDMNIQIENMQRVLKDYAGDVSAIRYIDVRLLDRAYYQ